MKCIKIKLTWFFLLFFNVATRTLWITNEDHMVFVQDSTTLDPSDH